MVDLPNYEIQKVIGSGSFGYVFKAYDHNNNRHVALKRIEKVGNQLSREYEILFEIKDSPYIIKILDFYYSRTDSNKLIQNIVFEFMDDNLENMLEQNQKNKKNFSQKSIKNYSWQILKGLEYIHSKNIAHRDLKPENILINKENQIKICDFGSSKIIDKKGKNTPYIVSRYYRAPELIMCVTNYSTAIDIWALGCIIAELVTKTPIFQGKTEGDQLFAIFKKIGSPSNSEYKKFKEIVPFEDQLFNEFPKCASTVNKDTFKNIRQQFIQSDNATLYDLLKKMWQYLPDKRITAKEALKHPFFDDVKEKN